MHRASRATAWKLARPPNYSTNINRIYPYSEVPYIGEYNLVRIPLSATNLIDHVDYWGEGKIETKAGNSGFANCYNVNHQYQLVSNGSDTDRKIPNRIPVINYTNCKTSSYIKDDSVKLVTVMGAPINKSCATDIARIVNGIEGRVIIFGFDENQQDTKNLDEELKVKGLFYCHAYELEEMLQGLTLFGDNSHRAFTNVTEMSEELRKKVVAGAYDSAISITLTLNENGNESFIATAVKELLEQGVKNIMTYAYKLTNSAPEIAKNNFPVPFELIFKSGFVKIMSKGDFKSAKLDTYINENGNRFAWSDRKDQTSNSIRWAIYPIWENNNVFFKIKHVEYNLFLKIADTTDEFGNRRIVGAEDSNDIHYQWSLEPLKIDDDLVFRIVDRKYNQYWKIDESSGSSLKGNSAINGDSDDLKWFISPCQ